MGEIVVDLSNGNNLGKKQKKSNFKKAGRIKKKWVKDLNDQECAVYLMNRQKMHLSKS